VSVFATGVGTGGTITGIGRYLKEQNPEVTVVGVDPEGSIYTADPDAGPHTYLTEGVGEDFWPDTFDRSVVDEWETVGDAEAFAMTRRLVREEGILAGGSGGMAIVGAIRAAKRHPDRLAVVVLPDGGRNYLSKIFDDGWMKEHGMVTE
jgi:cystathionine beta-synthase